MRQIIRAFEDAVRGILWSVLITGLVFVAYCVLRFLCRAFDYVNTHWFTNWRGAELIFMGIATLLVAWVLHLIMNRIRRARYESAPPIIRQNPRDRNWFDIDSFGDPNRR